MTQPRVPRISAVSYLNTCPLIWGLLYGLQQGRFDLKLELPAACARSLETGAVDVGLVPVIEMFRQKLEIVSDVCISSDGPVRSIFLLHRGPVKNTRSVAMDSSSRTSVALTRILLAERYGIRPFEQELAPDAGFMLREADAALLIGDPALQLDLVSADFEVLDLGAEWQQLTGLPMVYAVWAGRPTNKPQNASALFRDSYEQGRAQIAEIVAREAPKRQISKELAYRYLTEYIQYDLSSRALQGLGEFERLSRIHGLL